MAEKFQPPVQEIEITALGTFPDGRVNRVTAMILDSDGKWFSLVISTLGRIASDAIDSSEEILDYNSDEHERVFTAPGTEITPHEVEEIIHGIDPDFLVKFLTLQEET